MKFFITTALFMITALAEIVGCYLPYLWLREGEVELAIAASDLEFDVVCLAFDTASNSGSSCLRGIRWGLYHHRNSLALGCRWCQTESLGLTRCGSLSSRNGYHHVVTENLNGLTTSPSATQSGVGGW